MRQKTVLLAVAISLATSNVQAQLPTGSYFTSRDPSRDLVARYQKLSCAVVNLVKLDGSGKAEGAGTGFFVSKDGRLVTAAHVVFERSFTEPKPNVIQINVTWTSNLIVRGQRVKTSVIKPQALSEADAKRAEFDLAVIDTGIKTDCFLGIGDSERWQIGHRVISIGFPSSAPSGALYDGFLSARHRHLPTPIGFVPSGDAVRATYDVIRVQMPITKGVSGAPLIADDDSVIGVMSEIPVQWTKDLNKIVATFGNGTRSSGIRLSGFDTTKILSQLAWVVSEFETPGSGWAVPISYLNHQPEPREDSQPTIP